MTKLTHGLMTRTAATIILTACLALLASACGGSAGRHVAQLGTTATRPSTAAGSAGGSGKSIALEYSKCMRSHAVPKFPDFTNVNVLRTGAPKINASMKQLGVSSSALAAAETACRHLLPNGGQTTPAESQQDLNAMRRFASCMRSHGVPTWPDPTNGPAGWGFDLLHVSGFDPSSRQIENMMRVCERHLPPGTGIPLSRPG